MQNAKKQVNTGTMLWGTFFLALTILFIGLKLVGEIDWAWVWVISPLYVLVGPPIALLLFLFFVNVILGILGGVTKRLREYEKGRKHE